MKPRIHPFTSAALLVASFTLPTPCARAADQLWIGSAGDHNVTTASNWVGAAPSVDTWSPFIFGSDVVDGTVNLDRWVALSSLTLNSGLTHDITIDNGPVVMGGSLVDMSSAGADLTLNAQLQHGWGDMTFNVGAGRTLTSNGGVVESGWFGLHTGTGTLTLTGANTYTGATVINSGTLELGGAGTLGGGSYAGAITNYGEFVHSSSADQTLAAISGPGSITQSGASTLTLTSWGVGNSGTITVNSGTIQMPDGNWNQESHNIVVNGGTFSTSDGNSRALSWTLNGGTVSSRGDASPTFWGNVMLYDGQAVTVGGAAVSTISSHVMLGAGSEFAVGAGSTLNVTGALSNSVWAAGGNGSFIKSGDGTLAISNANNNFTGDIIVSTGKLLVNGAITGSGAVSIAPGATLGGTGSSAGAVIINGGTLSPGASIGKLTTGALTFNFGSTFAYAMDSGVLGDNKGGLQFVNGDLTLHGHINLALSASVFTPNTTSLSLIQYTGNLLGDGGFFFGATALTDGMTFSDGLNNWKINYAAASGGLNFANDLGGKFVTLSNLTAIPEPASLLAVCCLVGSGTFLRSRRRIHHATADAGR